MQTHRTSGRTGLGLGLAFATAVCWATLPLALHLTLEQLDPFTLTWFRFAVAFALVGGYLAARGELAAFAKLGRREWILLAIAAAMLIGNYVFYLLGLERTTPASAQLLIQLAPLSMAIGGIVVFREPFAPAQWGGAALLVAGLGLFFFEQISSALAEPGRYALGSAFIFAAAIVWAVYALLQKQLLVAISSVHVLFFIFGVATLALFPTATPSALARVDAWHWALLAFCSLNTIAAYGAFSEALAHLEASRVSVVLALNPLMTVGVVAAAHAIFPEEVEGPRVALLGLLGAALCVTGSIVTNLLAKRVRSGTDLPGRDPARE